MPRAVVRDYYGHSSAAVAVLLLHIVFIAALLNALKYDQTNQPHERETTLLLIPAEHGATRSVRAGANFHAPQSSNAITLPPLSFPDISGFGFALNSCAPENLTNLSWEDRLKCERRTPRYDATAVNIPVFRIRDRVRWERELAIKQSPPLAPCASPNNSALNLINLATALCLGDILVNGYDPDKMEHYSK